MASFINPPAIAETATVERLQRACPASGEGEKRFNFRVGRSGWRYSPSSKIDQYSATKNASAHAAHVQSQRQRRITCFTPRVLFLE